ncbi:MAG: hypothetical protein R2764_06120 [Bacteroidales bacterium]
MKNINHLPKYLLIVFLPFLMFSCGTDEKDPCDETARTEIQVSIKAFVHVYTMDDEPIVNELVKLNLYKIPCGATAKGFFEFNGATSEMGIYQSTVCGYNLRNLDDEVVVDIFVPNLGNGSASANSEYATYKYNDFISGSTKEVHVYVYKQN